MKCCFGSVRFGFGSDASFSLITHRFKLLHFLRKRLPALGFELIERRLQTLLRIPADLLLQIDRETEEQRLILHAEAIVGTVKIAINDMITVRKTYVGASQEMPSFGSFFAFSFSAA